VDTLEEATMGVKKDHVVGVALKNGVDLLCRPCRQEACSEGVEV
jgi:hypothetical protein